MKVLENVLNQRSWLLYILYCFILWVLMFLNTEYLPTEELFNHYTQEQLEESYTDQYNDIASEFEDDLEDFEIEQESTYITDYIIDFAFILMQTSIQFIIIGAFVYGSIVIFQVAEHISFLRILKAVIVAEYVFIIPRMVKFLWFSIKVDYSYQQLRDFSSMSLYNLMGESDYPLWLVYLLKALNIYEVIYCVLLVYCISIITKLQLKLISKPVILSYMLFLSMWVGLRVWINLLFTN